MRFVGLVLLLSLINLAAVAQFTTSKIVFKNPGPYLQTDLEATARLHSGQKISVDDLRAAAQRLSDSGYFDDVSVVVEGSNAATIVVFTLKPTDAKLLTPVGFENFVWLSPDELATVLRKTAPLFHGTLPDAGDLADTINAALTAALAAKGANVKVSHATLEPSTMQPMRAIEFRVEQPFVHIHSIGLGGVSPTMSAEVDAAVLKLKETTYNAGLAGETTQSRLLAAYSQDGYLDAKLTDIHYGISTANSTAAVVEIDVAARVDEGEQYRVASIDFAGTPLVPSTTLTASAKLHPGDIASGKALLATLAPVDAAYRQLGYMDVVVQSGAMLDHATHKVSYVVTVVPGEQYRVRSVNANGLDPAARAEFDKGWLMKPGEIYSANYVTEFLKNNSALKALGQYSAAFRASADPHTHLVDLTLNFVKTGGR